MTDQDADRGRAHAGAGAGPPPDRAQGVNRQSPAPRRRIPYCRALLMVNGSRTELMLVNAW